jgi:cell division septal protein FtsQ
VTLTRGRRQEVLKQYRERRSGSGVPEANESAIATPRVRRRRSRAAEAPGQRRRRSWSWRNPKQIVLALATIAAGAALMHLGISSRYVVTAPVVVGNSRLAASDLVASSELLGRRIFRIRPSRAAELVAAHPEVKEAQVTVHLPNQVWIHVVETAALLRWETPSGPFLIDENGRAVSAVGDPGGLVSVTDTQGYVKSVGALLPEGTVEAALAYAQQFHGLAYQKDSGFIGTTVEGVPVRLGTDPANVTRQVATLAALATRLQGRDLTLVDLRYERPYYRLRQDWGGSE